MTLVLFPAKMQDEAVAFEGKYYVRHGNSNHEVPVATEEFNAMLSRVYSSARSKEAKNGSEDSGLSKLSAF